jgi:hypothetical protein
MPEDTTPCVSKIGFYLKFYENLKYERKQNFFIIKVINFFSNRVVEARNSEERCIALKKPTERMWWELPNKRFSWRTSQ